MLLCMNYDTLTAKKRLLDSTRPLPPALDRNLDDWFRVELTYTSNAIEGNTLTRHETAVVIEKGITVGGKSLQEHLEAKNHAKALDFLHLLVNKKTSQLTAADILTIHEITLSGIDDANAEHYRNIPVRIAGSTVTLPNHRKVSTLMDELHLWLNTPNKLHPVAFAGEAHYRLVSIHPFVDGNGRTARLLMNLLLLMHGYPPAIIHKRDRLAYLTALEEAQLGGPKDKFETLIAKAVEASLDIYLDAVQSSVAMPNTKSEMVSTPITQQLFKIGELAKATSHTVATIRYWTKEGLLQIAEITPSGYQLYASNMVARCKEIDSLKAKRLTLKEIKDLIGQGKG